MKIGFDNDKYLAMQSEHIRERIQKFDNKLYLEFGGKLFDDYHASRVLPGFQPDSKLQMLLQLKDQAEIVIVISAEDIVSSKIRGDYGITYDLDVLRLIDAFQGVGLYVGSVRNEDGCETLFDALSRYAVEGPHYFDDDAYTDMPEKELVAEVIREKALLFMRDEIPHGIAVVVERFKERPGTDLIDIDVNIYCERESHKGMVIGKGGAMLKKIASAARADCEEFLGCRVNLQCWVKVKSDWRDNEFLLNNFGFKQNNGNR